MGSWQQQDLRFWCLWIVTVSLSSVPRLDDKFLSRKGLCKWDDPFNLDLADRFTFQELSRKMVLNTNVYTCLPWNNQHDRHSRQPFQQLSQGGKKYLGPVVNLLWIMFWSHISLKPSITEKMNSRWLVMDVENRLSRRTNTITLYFHALDNLDGRSQFKE